MTQFITVEELKAYPLPVKDAMWDKISDEQLGIVISAASENIEDYLDRRMASAYYSETLPGPGRPTLILDNRPILEVNAISSTDMSGNIVTYDVADVTVEPSAGLIRWTDMTRNSFSKYYWWTVQYRAGYTTIPGPVKHATALQTLSMLQPLFRGGSNFVEIDLIEGVNETIVDILEKYKNKRIG